MIAIVDYGAGNLTSVKLAFEALGAQTVVTKDPEVVRNSQRVVFPGVGAAKSAMANLTALGLVDVVRAQAVSGRPFLGICLGMQILFERTEEDGGVEMLGVVPGQVRRFPEDRGVKVPEIGWNQVHVDGSVPGLKDGDEFYFVHSYAAEPGPLSVGLTTYAGTTFTSMVRRGALWACQFHPEKSGRIGLNLLKGWLSC